MPEVFSVCDLVFPIDFENWPEHREPYVCVPPHSTSYLQALLFQEKPKHRMSGSHVAFASEF